MSNTLQGIVYLTPEQYETLVNDGHITANGKTITYNKNTLYITKADSAADSSTSTGGVNTIVATEAPTTTTVGEVGQFYLDTAKRNLYQLISISDDTYNWKLMNIDLSDPLNLLIGTNTTNFNHSTGVTVVGYGASAKGRGATAFGYNAQAWAEEAIQLGDGTNEDPHTLAVGRDTIYNTESHTLMAENISVGGISLDTKIKNGAEEVFRNVTSSNGTNMVLDAPFNYAGSDTVENLFNFIPITDASGNNYKFNVALGNRYYVEYVAEGQTYSYVLTAVDGSSLLGNGAILLANESTDGNMNLPEFFTFEDIAYLFAIAVLPEGADTGYGDATNGTSLFMFYNPAGASWSRVPAITLNDIHATIVDGKYVKTTQTINGKLLNSDIVLSAADLDTYTKSEVDNLISNIEPSESVDLTNYYTKEESDANYLGADTAYLATVGSAFYNTAQGLSVKDNTGAEEGLFLEESDFSFVVAGPHPNMRRVASLKDVVRTNVDQEVSGKTNFTGGLQKNGVDVATVDDITFDGDYNSLTNKPEIPSVAGLATETYVDTQIAALIDSAPETRNTLKELSDAIQENDTVIDTLNSAIGNKANKSDLDSLAETVTSNKKAADLINELCPTGTNAGIETGWVYADTFAYRNPVEGGTGVIDIRDKIYTDIVDYLPNVFYTKAILDNKITGQSLGGENMLPHDIYFVTRDELQAGTDHVGTTTKDGNPYVVPMQVGVEYSFDYTYGDESGTVTATTIDMDGVAVITELAIPGLTDTEGNATTVMIVGDTSVMGMDVATTYFNVTDPTGIDMSCCPQKRLTITKMYVGGGTDQLGPMIKDVDNLVNYYTKTEIDSKIPTVPTAISQLTNDTGFITDYTETDPTVPSHVKAITEANITSWNNKVESSTLNNYSLATHNHDLIYSKLNHGHAYNELTGKPTFATVATSGSYNDLLNKPTLFSGSYNDLTDKPTIPNTSNFITKDVNNLTNYTTTSALNTLLSAKAASSHTHSYNDLSDLPSTLNITSTQISLVEVD